MPAVSTPYKYNSGPVTTIEHGE